MYIHLFTNESLYSTELLKLFEHKINLQEHKFIFRKEKTGLYQYSSAIESRITYSTNFILLLKDVLPDLKTAKWIYFHYLPYGPSLLLWAFSPSLLSKATWIIWGGDVFIYKQKNDSIKHLFYELLRRKVIPKLPEIAAFLKEDAIEAMKVYHSIAQFVPILYPIPVNIEDLRGLEKQNNNGLINILIGNSADPANNHLEILDWLSSFSTENIRVYCPLSYYADQTYINEVIKKGKEVFKSQFIPLHNMISPRNYAIFLADIDIAIMNHNRQQGLGNIIPLLYLGKKVFIKSETSTFSFLIKSGCIIYDTNSLNKLNFASFISFQQSASEINRKVIELLINPEYYARLWINLFSRHM